MECGSCKNYFFAVDIAGYNAPRYCPYCGVKFEFQVETIRPLWGASVIHYV